MIWANRLRSGELLTSIGERKGQFRSNHKNNNKKELPWTSREKRRTDDECNGRERKWKERERENMFQLIDNITIKGRYELKDGRPENIERRTREDLPTRRRTDDDDDDI